MAILSGIAIVVIYNYFNKGEYIKIVECLATFILGFAFTKIIIAIGKYDK